MHPRRVHRSSDVSPPTQSPRPARRPHPARTPGAEASLLARSIAAIPRDLSAWCMSRTMRRMRACTVTAAIDVHRLLIDEAQQSLCARYDAPRLPPGAALAAAARLSRRGVAVGVAAAPAHGADPERRRAFISASLRIYNIYNCVLCMLIKFYFSTLVSMHNSSPRTPTPSLPPSSGTSSTSRTSTSGLLSRVAVPGAVTRRTAGRLVTAREPGVPGGMPRTGSAEI